MEEKNPQSCLNHETATHRSESCGQL